MTEFVGEFDREFVAVHAANGVGTLLLSRPPTNALTRQLCREIAAAAAQLGTRDDVRAVIVFGGHEIFCAGDDLAERRTLDAGEAAAARDACRRAVDSVAAIPKPTVAAITGYALGSGLTVALAADWRVSGDNAKFGATEIVDGLAPVQTATARLSRAVGESRAKDLVFTGRFVGATEALAIGLIDETVAPDHVFDAALSWAGRFADSSLEALAAAKASFCDPTR